MLRQAKDLTTSFCFGHYVTVTKSLKVYTREQLTTNGLQEQRAKQCARYKENLSCLIITVERTSLCTKRHGICGINDTHLHSKNVAIEFHGFISVSNLEDEMKSSPKRHLVAWRDTANYGAPRNYGKQNVKKWHFRVIGTLGARGFSCAVSGVGHVSIVTRAKNLIYRGFAARAMPTAFGRHFHPPREKTSGIQGTW